MYKDLDREIEEIIDLIDEMINSMLSINSGFSVYAGNFAQLCLNIFPRIVLSYTDEKLKEYSEDMSYWTDLLARIINALKASDKYKIIDLLYFEAKVSLSEYRSLLKRMELV